jgi:phage-related protein
MLNAMEFSVEFYTTESGRCPPKELLNEIKASDEDDFAAVMAGLARLRSRHYHRPPLSKALGKGLLELRHLGKLNTRLFWFFTRGCRIVVVHGIRNKGRDIPLRDLETALARKREWQRREDS